MGFKTKQKFFRTLTAEIIADDDDDDDDEIPSSMDINSDSVAVNISFDIICL